MPGQAIIEPTLEQRIQSLPMGGELRFALSGIEFRVRRQGDYYLASDLYGIPDDLDGEAFASFESLKDEIMSQVMK